MPGPVVRALLVQAVVTACAIAVVAGLVVAAAVFDLF